MPPPTNDTTHSPFTLISQDAYHILRLAQRPLVTTLSEFTGSGKVSIDLCDSQLQAVLRALPAETLQAALKAQEAMRMIAAMDELPPMALWPDVIEIQDGA